MIFIWDRFHCDPCAGLLQDVCAGSIKYNFVGVFSRRDDETAQQTTRRMNVRNLDKCKKLHLPYACRKTFVKPNWNMAAYHPTIFNCSFCRNELQLCQQWRVMYQASYRAKKFHFVLSYAASFLRIRLFRGKIYIELKKPLTRIRNPMARRAFYARWRFYRVF